MDDRQKILDALSATDPSCLTYQEWIDVGMALNAEGFPVSIWDDWSRKDSLRYHPGDCEKKWDTFHGVGTTAGTIFHLATLQGYKPKGKVYTWDDYLPAEVENYEETIATNSPKKDKPYQMAIKYLETLFEPGEFVGYVHSAIFKEDRQKWIPANAGVWRKRDDIIADLKRYRNFDAFGTINENAGAWIRINPLDGKGAGDKNVTRYTYALAEADSMPIEEQKKLLINLKLPIAALVESGGKSVHAVVKIGASNKAEYDQRVAFLFTELAKHNFIVDTNNKNPSRLSRLPGVMRGDKCQTLLATNIGCSSWEEWLDELAGINDDLPPIVSFPEMLENPPEEVPELIHGVLHVGCKMIITADSKAGKSCMAENLAICIAEGKPWMNTFQCEKGRVLYIDLELSQRAIYDRTKLIRRELDITTSIPNLEFFPLRGYAESLESLLPKIVRRARSKHYSAIVIDPLYKIQSGDENSAEALSKFCNALDRLSRQTGAALIITHHHPKGKSGERKALDRGAGSGVIARDADAIIDLSYLDPGTNPDALVAELLQKKHQPMQMSFILRDFESPEDKKVFFKFPIHFFDTDNVLKGMPLEGSREANLNRSPNRTSPEWRKKTLDDIFDAVQMDGAATLKDMNKYADGKPAARTLRRYIDEFSKDYKFENGVVTKL